jgi:hypothetical protein
MNTASILYMNEYGTTGIVSAQYLLSVIPLLQPLFMNTVPTVHENLLKNPGSVNEYPNKPHRGQEAFLT